VGNLNGAASVDHVAEYHSWLPSIDAHYLLQRNWSAYAQYGKGQNIPPSSVFDVKNAAVAILPKPTLTDTVQFGSVWKADRFTLDVDFYHIHFENDYSSSPDPITGEPVYYLAGSAVTEGLELESNILVVRGFGVYLNATTGSAKYVDTGLWVQNAPKDTETVGLSYNQGSWNVGFFNKRIGTMYNDNSGINQAVAIDPFNITNLFVNYTLRGSSRLAQSRIRVGVNNLFDKRYIVGVTPASKTTSVAAPGDVLNLMAARSVSVTFTVGLSPRSTP
jgi:iron complex outermembrane receptor protein